MTRDERILGKIVLIIIGLLIIGYIFMVSIRMNMVKQPEGEYIRLEDAMILAEALDEELGKNEVREEDAGGIYAGWKAWLLPEKGRQTKRSRKREKRIWKKGKGKGQLLRN